MHKKSPSKIWRKFKNRYSTETHLGNLDIYNSTAKLVTWSEISAPPEGFEAYKPYIVAVVELSSGERITSQIVDTSIENLQKGDTLYPTFRKYYQDGADGIIHYGLKWTKRLV